MKGKRNGGEGEVNWIQQIFIFFVFDFQVSSHSRRFYFENL